MTISPLLSCDNLPFEKAATIYIVAPVLNGTRPPSPNDVLPLLRSALFIPLVQSLREVDRTSDLKVDVVWIRLICRSEVGLLPLEESMFNRTHL